MQMTTQGTPSLLPTVMLVQLELHSSMHALPYALHCISQCLFNCVQGTQPLGHSIQCTKGTSPTSQGALPSAPMKGAFHPLSKPTSPSLNVLHLLSSFLICLPWEVAWANEGSNQ